MTRSQVVVVGGSLAGVRAAESLRRHGFGGRLVLVGVETHYPPFDRPPLSKDVLKAGIDAPGKLLNVDADLELDLLLGRRALELDAAGRRVVLDDGAGLDFDGLVVATGGSPRRLPGVALGGRVHELRTVQDAFAIRAGLHEAVTSGGGRVAVIGAGVLGCEVAATARSLGLDVSLIDVFEQPMLRVLGPTMAEQVGRMHAENGVELLLGRQVHAVNGSSGSIRLQDGQTVVADVVVVAIGMVPETDWLRGSGLTVTDGVVCDAYCFAEGSDRSVVAAGDVARWHHPVLGREVRVEHWTNAVAQGQRAGRNLWAAMSGREEPEPYADMPYFWSEQYGHRLQVVGTLGDEASFDEGATGDPRYVVAYRSAGRLVGALCMNWPARLQPMRQRIAAEAVSLVPGT